MITSDDGKYMKRVLRLARKGMGNTSPNPMVGAVLVKNGRIIGEGYHHHFGGTHAEILALTGLRKRDTSGSTLYVNLEPCCHHGKTPPCIDPILESGIARVVIGTVDPNPKVNGKSIEKLKATGIEVTVGVLENACRELNFGYLHHIRTGIPWVTVKIAQSLDGRIADSTGRSRWITSDASRKAVHKLRAAHDAVLMGVNTVVIDNPQLTVRHVRGPNPHRIIIDPKLRIPTDAALFDIADSNAPWIVTSPEADTQRKTELESTGAKIITVDTRNGKFPWELILQCLGKNGITSVLVEGGSTVFTGLLREVTVNRLVICMAPILLGGDALPALHDMGIGSLDSAFRYRITRQRRLGDDLWMELEPAISEKG